MSLEKELRRIAKEYESEGYSVILHPEGDQVPAFAAGLKLDMIGTCGEEKVVIEIKERRSALNEDPTVQTIANLVDQQPGWRFDLIILEPETPLQRVVEKAQEPSKEQIREILNRAQMACSANLTEMALIFAWAGMEAAMRRISKDGEWYGRTTPLPLLSALYSNGFLNRKEFDTARTAWSIRTQAVHGFVIPEIDSLLIEEVMAIATKLISSEETQTVAATG